MIITLIKHSEIISCYLFTPDFSNYKTTAQCLRSRIWQSELITFPLNCWIKWWRAEIFPEASTYCLWTAPDTFSLMKNTQAPVCKTHLNDECVHHYCPLICCINTNTVRIVCVGSLSLSVLALRLAVGCLFELCFAVFTSHTTRPKLQSSPRLGLKVLIVLAKNLAKLCGREQNR